MGKCVFLPLNNGHALRGSGTVAQCQLPADAASCVNRGWVYSIRAPHQCCGAMAVSQPCPKRLAVSKRWGVKNTWKDLPRQPPAEHDSPKDIFAKNALRTLDDFAPGFT